VGIQICSNQGLTGPIVGVKKATNIQKFSSHEPPVNALILGMELD